VVTSLRAADGFGLLLLGVYTSMAAADITSGSIATLNIWRIRRVGGGEARCRWPPVKGWTSRCGGGNGCLCPMPLLFRLGLCDCCPGLSSSSIPRRQSSSAAAGADGTFLPRRQASRLRSPSRALRRHDLPFPTAVARQRASSELRGGSPSSLPPPLCGVRCNVGVGFFSTTTLPVLPASLPAWLSNKGKRRGGAGVGMRETVALHRGRGSHHSRHGWRTLGGATRPRRVRRGGDARWPVAIHWVAQHETGVTWSAGCVAVRLCRLAPASVRRDPPYARGRGAIIICRRPPTQREGSAACQFVS